MEALFVKEADEIGTPWFYRMDDHGETPLSRAKASGYPALAKMLSAYERKHKTVAQETEDSSALHRAAYWGLGDTVAQLLDAGADPDEEDDAGDTPIVKAARNGCRAALEALLRHGADVNAKGSDGMTPLHWVALTGRRDIAELLLKQGAEVNAREKGTCGLTPAGMALLMGYYRLVDLLAAHGGSF